MTTSAAMVEGAGLDAAAVAYAQRARVERKRPAFGWDSLTATATEIDVVALVAGLTNPQIGQRLLISRDTVKTHLAHVFTKLAVHNQAELSAQAVQHGQAPSAPNRPTTTEARLPDEAKP